MKKLLICIHLMYLFTAYGCSAVSSNNIQDVPSKAILVSAAASMTDVMLDIKQQFEKQNKGYSIKLNFGSSGALQQQIAQGAPADVFVSAGKKQMDSLIEKGYIAQSKIIAKNTLVLILSKNSKPAITEFSQLAQANFQKVAIGNPETVPAGTYAEEALVKAGIWKSLKDAFVYAKDVRQVLTYVETGNANAGIVYKTDALKSNLKVIEISPAYHSEILYLAAVVKSTKEGASAQKFLDFLESQDTQEILAKYGFDTKK